MEKLPNWYDIYPSGSKEGDEELKFFIALARNSKYQWRSVSAIAKESGLTRERVEEIIEKYYKKGMVFQNPKNEDQWSYWQRTPEMIPKIQKTISQKDQDDRINKLNKDCKETDIADRINKETDLADEPIDCLFACDSNTFYVDVKGIDAQIKFVENNTKLLTKKQALANNDMAYFRNKFFKPLKFPKM